MSLFPPAFELAFDQQLWLYRLLTLILVSPLPLLTYWLALTLTPNRSIQFGATVFPFLVTGLHIRNGAMINNDNMLLLLIALLLVVLCRIAGGDTRRHTAALAGLLTGLAILTKTLAIVMPPALLVAYFIAYRHGARSQVVIMRALLASFVSFVAGGWWLLRNLIVYGDLQPGGVGLTAEAAQSFQPAILDWLSQAGITNVRTFFGALAVRSPDFNPPLFWGLVTLIVAGTVASLFSVEIDRGRLWLTLSPLLLLVGILMINSYFLYAETGLVKGESGRYLYPWLPAIGLAVGAGVVKILALWRRTSFFVRYLPLALLVGGLMLQYSMISGMLRQSWGPPGGDLADQWEALVAWAPFSTPWLLLFGALTVFAAVGATLLAVTYAVWGRPSLLRDRASKPAQGPVDMRA